MRKKKDASGGLREKVKADKNEPEKVIGADGYSQLPDAGLLLLGEGWIFSGGPEEEDRAVSRPLSAWLSLFSTGANLIRDPSKTASIWERARRE